MNGHAQTTVVYMGDSRYAYLGRSFADAHGFDLFNVVSSHPGTEHIGPYMISNGFNGDHSREYHPKLDINPFVSHDPAVDAQLETLSRRGDIIIVPYHTSDLSLPYPIVGPSSEITGPLNNKHLQTDIARAVGIPVPRQTIVESYPDLERTLERDFNGQAFVSLETSYGGYGNGIVRSLQELHDNPNISRDGPYAIAELLEVERSPSCMVLAASEHDAVILGMTDQILDRTHYRGNTHPTATSSERQHQIEEYSTQFALHLAREYGYRGVFGLDFMDTQNGLYGIDLNPRFTSWVGELGRQWDRSRNGRPTLVDMELMAVTDSWDADLGSHLDLDPLSWIIYQPHASPGFVTPKVPAYPSEDDIFERGSGVTIAGAPPEGAIFREDGKFGRVVSVGQTTREAQRQFQGAAHYIDTILSQQTESVTA